MSNWSLRRRLKLIAAQAIDRKMGARGLRLIIEDLTLDIMYHLPSQEGLRRLVVTEAMVRKHEVSLSAMLLEKAG